MDSHLKVDKLGLDLTQVLTQVVKLSILQQIFVSLVRVPAPWPNKT